MARKMIAMTPEQRRRTVEALGDTVRLRDREARYALHLQKPDRIASYNRHILKLLDMIASNEVPDPFAMES